MGWTKLYTNYFLLLQFGFLNFYYCFLAPWGPRWFKMRISPPYPHAYRKMQLNGAVSRNNRKNVCPVSVLGRGRKRILQNVYCVGSPTVGSASSSIRLHRCAVTYITEISLHVSLNNQSNSLSLLSFKILKDNWGMS